jgi:asparagine synthase (glutamine-hydrolysing)
MSFGVEGRLPFLDHRIVELASSCDAKNLISWSQGKLAMRTAAENRVGCKIAWRKKIPFLMNVANDSELRTRGILALDALKSRGLIEPSLTAEMISDSPGSFLAGKRLFALDALETWIRSYEVEV